MHPIHKETQNAMLMIMKMTFAVTYYYIIYMVITMQPSDKNLHRGSKSQYDNITKTKKNH